MNELTSNCAVKKTDNDCPSPYGTTLPNGLRQTASPSMHHPEPMYATVKRTAARTAVTRQQSQADSCHVYQYPLTLIGSDSCFDGGDSGTGTAYLQMQTVADSEDKNMTAVPLLISEDGRQISVGTIRTKFHRSDNYSGR